MRDPSASTISWRRSVPEGIGSLDALMSPDYTDICTATASGRSGTSPEPWIRAILDHRLAYVRGFAPLAQRVLLGLRLESRPSPDHFLGWKVAERSDNWFRIEAGSWFLTGHVIFHVDGDMLSVASFVRYDRPIAALIWPVARLIHRKVVYALMRQWVSVE